MALLDARRKFIAHRGIYSLHAAQLGIDLRSHYITGELSGEKIDGNERHHHQQHGGNHADEHVSDDQPVAQAPQKLSPQPAEGENGEQYSRVENQKLDPPSEAIAGRRGNQPQQYFQNEERHGQAQRIAGSARDPALRP